MRSIAWIAVALPVFSTGCVGTVTVLRPALTGSSSSIESSLVRVCPKSTTGAKEAQILAELENLNRTGELAKVDTLATEWERLNDGAKSCKQPSNQKSSQP